MSETTPGVRRWSHKGLKTQYCIYHDCGPYCRPDEDVHCIPFYSAGPDHDHDNFRAVLEATLEQKYGATLVDVRPAPELPPIGDQDCATFAEHRPGSRNIVEADLPAAGPGYIAWVRGATIIPGAGKPVD